MPPAARAHPRFRRFIAVILAAMAVEMAWIVAGAATGMRSRWNDGFVGQAWI